MNPNVANRLPVLYKAGTGISTNKNKTHNSRGRFKNICH